MKQRLLLNLAAVGIALLLVFSIFNTVFYTLTYQIAGSPDCDKPTNSSVICEPSQYVVPLLAWGFVSLFLIVAAVFFNRVQSKYMLKRRA